ncbi:hypothetical protein ACFYZE_04820 [Streptomyces sp. NPDC001796]
MALTETDLLKAGDAGLVELFRKSSPGDIPKGPLQGTRGPGPAETEET